MLVCSVLPTTDIVEHVLPKLFNLNLISAENIFPAALWSVKVPTLLILNYYFVLNIMITVFQTHEQTCSNSSLNHLLLFFSDSFF